jgi:hypothetical protein
MKALKEKTTAKGRKSITLKVTPAQRALLEKETKRVFTKMTFTFGLKPMKPPKYRVSCVLDRLTRPTKGKQ